MVDHSRLSKRLEDELERDRRHRTTPFRPSQPWKDPLGSKKLVKSAKLSEPASKAGLSEVSRLAALEKENRHLVESDRRKDASIKATQHDIELLNSLLSGLAAGEGNNQKEASCETFHDDTSYECAGTTPHEVDGNIMRLKARIRQINSLLLDNGLIWKGDAVGDCADKASLIPGGPAGVTYDDVVRLLQTNSTRGSTVTHEPASGVARLVTPGSVEITLYSDGVYISSDRQQSSSGLFLSFSETEGQRFLRDAIDGYQPIQLRREYPQGVRIAVNDKRYTVYVPCATAPLPMSNACTSQGSDKLLEKLPRAVVRDGLIVEIRDEIRQLLQGTDSVSQLSCREAREARAAAALVRSKDIDSK